MLTQVRVQKEILSHGKVKVYLISRAIERTLAAMYCLSKQNTFRGAICCIPYMAKNTTVGQSQAFSKQLIQREKRD